MGRGDPKSDTRKMGRHVLVRDGFGASWNLLACLAPVSLGCGGGKEGNSIYFVWYRHAAGVAPIFQVIYTSIGHDFISNIHL